MGEPDIGDHPESDRGVARRPRSPIAYDTIASRLSASAQDGDLATENWGNPPIIAAKESFYPMRMARMAISPGLPLVAKH
jgi:hypothetical protein